MNFIFHPEKKKCDQEKENYLSLSVLTVTNLK